MKKFLFLFTLIFFNLVHARCELVRPVVFIHGIASNKGAFGQWDKYLTKNYPEECFSPYFFEYDTGNNQLDLNDFITEFDKFMHQKFDGVKTKDITIVAHSQGGLITFFWLKKLFDKGDLLASRVNNIMTMATPFYGARIANLGVGLGTYILPNLGKKELRDMKIGSKKVIETWQLFTDINFHSFISQKNFISISAVLAPSWYNPDIEGDFAVSPFSSNPNIVGMTPISKHYNIQGVHLRFNILATPATTLVSKKCLNSNYDCKNSSLGIFETEFIGERRVDIREAKNINTFALYYQSEDVERKRLSVSGVGVKRGLQFKLEYIRDGLYFYKGRLEDGLSETDLIIDNNISVPISNGQTTFFTR